MTEKKEKESRLISSPIPLLHHNTRSSKTQIHDEIISFLADCIYRAFKNVNYDHITTTTPKLREIPLQTGKRYTVTKFDIAFLYENRLILIEVKTEVI